MTHLEEARMAYAMERARVAGRRPEQASSRQAVHIAMVLGDTFAEMAKAMKAQRKAEREMKRARAAVRRLRA